MRATRTLSVAFHRKRSAPTVREGENKSTRREAANLAYVREVGVLNPAIVLHLYRKIAVPSFEYNVPSTLFNKSLAILSNV